MSPIVLPDAARAIDRLCVFFACHAFLCAVRASAVVRLVTIDDAHILGPHRDAPLDGTRVVDTDGDLHAGWDLSRLFEIPPLAGAFVILRIPHRGVDVPIALRTGACLFVRDLGDVTPVPRALFRSRIRAIAGAFEPPAARGASAGSIGLEIDPSRLFTPDELDTSLAAVDKARAARARDASTRERRAP